MRIIKHGHACVTLATSTATIVVDPGMFTDAGALDGADAVLITHEHPDHCVDVYGLHVLLRYGLERSGVPVYAPAGADDRLGTLASWGDTFDWHGIDDGARTTVGSIGRNRPAAFNSVSVSRRRSRYFRIFVSMSLRAAGGSARISSPRWATAPLPRVAMRAWRTIS